MKRVGGSHSGMRRESGMALMMVMGVMAAIMLLLAHIMLVSQLISRESYQVTMKESMRYRAESAAETAFWLHLTDRRLFSNRTLGQSTENTTREDEDFAPWMLDGTPHEMDEGNTVVYLASAENGTQVTNLKQLKDGLDASDDADYLADIDDFISCYEDYIDSDDLVKLNGMETEEYSAAGFYTLPRNGAMQFKQELFWIPNWENIVTGAVMIVPPSGISYTASSNGRPSFFTATDEEFCKYLNIEQDSMELREIREAIDEWNTNKTPIEDSLDIDLLTQVKNRFSFEEAGLAIVAAQATEPNREIEAGYRVIREAKINSKTFFSDTHKECFSIWERYWE